MFKTYVHTMTKQKKVEALKDVNFDMAGVSAVTEEEMR